MEKRVLAKEDFLGRGSHGCVFSASSSDRPLALKSASASHSSLLAKEKRVLDELQHCPEIIRCYGDHSGMEDGKETYNLLLECAPGGSLSDLIRNSGCALPEPDVRRYTRMIVKGLCSIHETGYVHCDIKPSNILVFPTKGGGNEVKIADFGLSKRAGEQRALLLPQFSGTPAYMSPESVVYGEDEPPLDVWSLGITVVEMLTGELAWRKLGKEELLFSIVFEQPEIPNGVSEDGKDFLRRCFRREAKERWTAAMLLNHPFVAEKPPSAVDGETSHFFWNPWQLRDPSVSTDGSCSSSSSSSSSTASDLNSHSLVHRFFSSVQSFCVSQTGKDSRKD